MFSHRYVPTAVALLSLVAQGAFAQAYPSKPIRVLSTFTAGSVADGAMRLVGQKMQESMGTPVIVEVASGGGGVLAGQTLVRSAPDGYTILHCAPTTIVATPFLLKNPPYDPLKDFTYITHMADATTSMLATINAPFNNIKEFIAYTKANPGKIAYGSNGVGASYHLEMSLFAQKYGVDVIHVPYKGGQEGLNAAAAGQIPVAFAPAASAYQQAKAGKVKILAVVTNGERYPGLPQVPTLKEQGYDLDFRNWVAMFLPTKTPQAIVTRWNGEVNRLLKDRAWTDKFFVPMALTPTGGTPEEFAAFMKRDMAQGAELAKIANLRLD